MDHAPLPWWVYDSKHIKTVFPGIESSSGTIVVFGWSEYDEAGVGGNTPEERSANAEFIVRACNSHYELVKTLEDAKKELQTIRMKDGAGPYDPTLKAAIDIVLAKAKEEQ